MYAYLYGRQKRQVRWARRDEYIRVAVWCGDEEGIEEEEEGGVEQDGSDGYLLLIAERQRFVVVYRLQVYSPGHELCAYLTVSLYASVCCYPMPVPQDLQRCEGEEW